MTSCHSGNALPADQLFGLPCTNVVLSGGGGGGGGGVVPICS